jgi:hypothetical protein
MTVFFGQEMKKMVDAPAPGRVRWWLSLPAVVDHFGGKPHLALAAIEGVPVMVCEDGVLRYYVVVAVY